MRQHETWPPAGDNLLYTGGSICVLAWLMYDYDRTKAASATLGKLKRAAPHFRKALQDLYRENRGGNPKVVSAITYTGKKFNEVIDLLEVVEYETAQELRER